MTDQPNGLTLALGDLSPVDTTSRVVEPSSGAAFLLREAFMAKAFKTIGKKPTATKMPKATAVRVSPITKPAKPALGGKGMKAGKLGKGC